MNKSSLTTNANDQSTGVSIYRTVEAIRRQVQDWRHAGESIGLVPTMGALHDGHLSLAKASKQECDRTIATIFVNPLQFGPNEDLSEYPRTWDADLAALTAVGVDAVFAPTTASMYPPDCTTLVEPPKVAQRWEGECRPGHFQGVVTVVLKLFNIVQADVAFFGQKDYQQSLVIERMVTDLNLPITIQVCPIVREADGLALSSRNVYLTKDERMKAAGLFEGLSKARQSIHDGITNADKIDRQVRQAIEDHCFDKIDYIAIADPITLEPITHVQERVVIAVAAYIGSTRLIDNIVVSLSDELRTQEREPDGRERQEREHS